jgi:5-methylthioadenosine/S-adenosylhomocysteine deaminase
LLFHCVQVDEADIATIGSTGTLVVHCPVSNLWSGAGRMPLVPMLAQGIPILLGTDFLQHDFWEVMRTAYYGLKEQSMGCYGINDVFAMATTNAEHIGGSSLYKGVVREGAPADLTFIRMDDCLKPLVEVPGFSNSLHNVITQTKPDMVRHLMVDGKWIMRDRKVLTVDEDSIEAGYRRICGNLFPNCLNSMA